MFLHAAGTGSQTAFHKLECGSVVIPLDQVIAFVGKYVAHTEWQDSQAGDLLEMKIVSSCSIHVLQGCFLPGLEQPN